LLNTHYQIKDSIEAENLIYVAARVLAGEYNPSWSPKGISAIGNEFRVGRLYQYRNNKCALSDIRFYPF
jgi:hypothetical protein